MTTKHKDGVEPTERQMDHIMGLKSGLTLEELFVSGRAPGKERLTHLAKVARLMVVSVFRMASANRPGQLSFAEYSVPGVSGSPEELVRYILTNMKGTFVRTNDLPEQYRHLTRYWRESVRRQACCLLIGVVIDELVAEATQLWYHAGDQRWQAAQSLIDEFGLLTREVKNLSKPRHRKRDNRNWHGRPERDRRRKGVPSSVGGCHH